MSTGEKAVASDDLSTRLTGCQCDACRDGETHSSDCAVHNAPALPVGPCDCAVPAPSPARVLAVTEAVDIALKIAADADDKKAGLPPWEVGEAVALTFEAQGARKTATALEATLFCTSPPETVGGGGGSLERARHLADALNDKLESACKRIRKLEAELEAALSSAPPAEETWQSIETVTRTHGEHMLLWVSGWNTPAIGCFFEHSNVFPEWVGRWVILGGRVVDPTHARPLPPGPAGESK